jgi:hypothetical protein
MSDQRGTQQSEYLNQVSAELGRSLRRCHLLIDDYRAQLAAANSNEAPFMLGKAQSVDDERSDS